MNNLIRALLCSLMFTNYAYSYSTEEIECLAQNIYHEARGESVQGRMAVGFVTMNRVKSSKFPSTICGVVKQAKYSNWWRVTHNKNVPLKNQCQFSWWCDGLPDKVRDKQSWEKAIALAESIIQNRFVDVTNGSLYYHEKNISPYWSKHFTLSVIIGNHIFYI